MRWSLPILTLCVGLSACAEFNQFAAVGDAEVVPASAVVAPPPETAIETPPPPAAAVTVEEFDTTSEEERAAALTLPAAAAETALGSTIASLGPPADPGIWLSTPLVDGVVQGRVEYPAGGTSVSLELRPSGGEPGSGSQISLAAMRLLEAPLTGLPELLVYR